jgi:hypothetical protein
VVSPLEIGWDSLVVKSTIFIIAQEKSFVNRISRFLPLNEERNSNCSADFQILDYRTV